MYTNIHKHTQTKTLIIDCVISAVLSFCKSETYVAYQDSLPKPCVNSSRSVISLKIVTSESAALVHVHVNACFYVCACVRSCALKSIVTSSVLSCCITSVSSLFVKTDTETSFQVCLCARACVCVRVYTCTCSCTCTLTAFLPCQRLSYICIRAFARFICVCVSAPARNFGGSMIVSPPSNT